jgi:Arc/MetJ-type ribon-helix-helix transcriptional regulator
MLAGKLHPMQINLTPEQEVFVRQAIASGRFKSVEEATKAAFDLCEEHEHDDEELFGSGSTSDWLLAAAGVVAMLMLAKATL